MLGRHRPMLAEPILPAYPGRPAGAIWARKVCGSWSSRQMQVPVSWAAARQDWLARPSCTISQVSVQSSPCGLCMPVQWCVRTYRPGVRHANAQRACSADVGRLPAQTLRRPSQCAAGPTCCSRATRRRMPTSRGRLQHSVQRGAKTRKVPGWAGSLAQSLKSNADYWSNGPAVITSVIKHASARMPA